MRPRLLQIAGGAGDADAAHPQHVRQKLLGEVKPVGMRPILAHQQPAGEPRADAVETCASGRRRQLCHQHVEVAVKYPLQRLARAQLAPERRRSDAPRALTPSTSCTPSMPLRPTMPTSRPGSPSMAVTSERIRSRNSESRRFSAKARSAGRWNRLANPADECAACAPDHHVHVHCPIMCCAASESMR